ncbi:MAG: ACP S-malonyltransferase [Eubacteriales bacterium]
MSIAFIYAGQGSQFTQMGLDLYEQEPIYKTSLDSIDLDGTIKKLSFESDLETLSKTEHTQPCMVAFAISLTNTLYHYGVIPDYVAGLSLGEYSALYAAGVLTLEQAISLITFRGEIMATACKDIPCGMSAVLGLDKILLNEACIKASHLGVVSIANYNCPGQLIISGEQKALNLASKFALELGARRILPLNVSGAFHTSLMNKAGNQLKERFTKETFGIMKVPVIFNSTALPLQNYEHIPDLLVKQVQNSVYFEDSIRYMIDKGVTTFLEIGPGKILSGFIKKIDSTKTIYQIDNVSSLHKTIEQLK